MRGASFKMPLFLCVSGSFYVDLTCVKDSNGYPTAGVAARSRRTNKHVSAKIASVALPGTPDVDGVAAQSLRFMVFGHFFG